MPYYEDLDIKEKVKNIYTKWLEGRGELMRIEFYQIMRVQTLMKRTESRIMKRRESKRFQAS